MALFKKSDDKKGTSMPPLPELPKLPELPELPEIPSMEMNETEFPQLPSFPRSSLGNKFSQDTIKDAIAGRKEEGVGSDADEFVEEEDVQRMQEPIRGFQKTREIGELPMRSSYPAVTAMGKTEPIFVRLDKFEESMKLFEKTKEQLSEIQRTLSQIKRTKEQEDKEIQFWEQEMQRMKEQIERIDKDIFSRLE